MSPEDEKQRVEELQKRLSDVTPIAEEPEFLHNTETFRRFLVARQWRLDDAEKLLRATVEWRKQYKPSLKDCKWCRERPGFHGVRQIGFDKKKRPVVYSCFAQQATRKNLVEDTVAHCTYLMENIEKTMGPGASKIVWVIDCTGMTMACCNPKLGYGCAQVFANFYPERLALVICINHNPVFQGVWKAIKVFLDPLTASKVQLTRSKDKMNEIFQETFPPDLCKWMKDEITLNKQKKIPKSQKQFWEFPMDPKAHDPRGCIDYIMNYIEPYIAYCHKPDAESKGVHKPHPNIIDRLKGDVQGSSDLPPLEDETFDEEAINEGVNGATGVLEIPKEYQIDESVIAELEDNVVTRL